MKQLTYEQIKELRSVIKSATLLKYETLKEYLSNNDKSLFEEFLRLTFDHLDKMTNPEDIITQAYLIDAGFEEFKELNSKEETTKFH